MNHHRIFPVYNYRFLLLALHRSLIMLTTSIHLNDRFGHEICCSNDLLEKNSLTAKELGMVLMQPDYIFLERKGGLYFVRFIGRRKNLMIHVKNERTYYRLESIQLNPTKEDILELLTKTELQVFSW